MYPNANSIISSVQWPALASGIQAELMSLQFQLQQHEHLSPKKIQQLQLKQLSRLVTHADSSTDFYSRYYRQKGYQPLTEITEENLLSIPLLTRDDLQSAGDSIHSKSVPLEHVVSGEITTSGSTGKPITVKTTQVSQFIGYALTLRDHRWHQRDLNKKLCVIKYFGQGAKPPHGTKYDHWSLATSAIYDTGPSVCLSISATVSEQFDWLVFEKPYYLLTYPSNLLELITYAKNNNLHFPKLKEIRTLGEVVTDQLRTVCSEELGLSVADAYSCQELGYLAIQCPKHDHYHVQCENVLLEVINADGEPCKAGETGKVVISSLNNFASPLIRYDIGDYAQVGEPCDCGIKLPVLNKIMGRERNMVTYPDGNKRWPFVGSSQFRSIADIRQFQIIQHAIDSVEVKLVVADKLSFEQESSLIRVIQAALMFPFKITFSYPPKIERSAGGKYEDFISMVTT